MAMHLSLPEGGGDVRPEYNNIPQFMFFNNVHELPAFWRPFASLPLTLASGVLLWACYFPLAWGWLAWVARRLATCSMSAGPSAPV